MTDVTFFPFACPFASAWFCRNACTWAIFALPMRNITDQPATKPNWMKVNVTG